VLDIDIEQPRERWRLLPAERGLVESKNLSNQLTFAVLLAFFLDAGRFPRSDAEIDPEMVDALVHQFDLHNEIASYETALTRTVKRNRAEIRAFFGFRETSVEDGEALSAWLRDHAVAQNRDVIELGATLEGECRRRHLEPPAADRIDRIVRSALSMYEELPGANPRSSFSAHPRPFRCFALAGGRRRSSGRSGRRRWKWRAAVAKRSCTRRTAIRFRSESRRFQIGNAWVAGLIARLRSISLRHGRACSTAHNDRWTSCKSTIRSSISSWSTMSNACPSGGRGSRWPSTCTAAWWQAFTSRSIRPARLRQGYASPTPRCPKKPGLQSWGAAGSGRAGDLRRVCERYGIVLEYRPVAQPHMGGHIERLLGTLTGALHELPGATFSSPQQRGTYNSDAAAVMTLREIERWLTQYIVGVYHAKQHRRRGPIHRDRPA
jgi:hypothetical protein